MKKYVCEVCGYVYDESKEKVPFAQLPDDWTCPLCGVGKDQFKEEAWGPDTQKRHAVQSLQSQMVLLWKQSMSFL